MGISQIESELSQSDMGNAEREQRPRTSVVFWEDRVPVRREVGQFDTLVDNLRYALYEEQASADRHRSVVKQKIHGRPPSKSVIRDRIESVERRRNLIKEKWRAIDYVASEEYEYAFEVKRNELDGVVAFTIKSLDQHDLAWLDWSDQNPGVFDLGKDTVHVYQFFRQRNKLREQQITRKEFSKWVVENPAPDNEELNIWFRDITAEYDNSL